MLLLLSAPTGHLVVHTPHYGAVVLVDRQPRGTVPVEPIELPVGLHLVEATSPGRPRWQQLVWVPAAGAITVRIRWVEAPQQAALPHATHAVTPAPEPTRVQLAGRIGLAGAQWRGERDLDSRLRWHLQWARARFQAALSGRADTDLTTGGRLLRRVEPERSTLLQLNEAWVGRQTTEGRARLGRLLHAGPVGWARLLDGAALERTLGPLKLHLTGGRQVATVGARPALPWLARAGLSGTWAHTHWHLTAWQIQRQLVTAVRAQRPLGRWRLGLDGHHVDRRLGRAAVRARWQSLDFGWALEALVDHTAEGPFSPLALPDLLAPARRRFAALRWTADGQTARWRWRVNAALRRSEGGAIRSNHMGAQLLHRVGQLDVGVRTSGLLSEGQTEASALRRAGRLGVLARARINTVTIDTTAGAAMLDLERATSSTWRPETQLRLRWAWSPQVALVARLAARVIHPSLGDGLLTTGGLALVLQ
jgi:hypothetical protein